MLDLVDWVEHGVVDLSKGVIEGLEDKAANPTHREDVRCHYTSFVRVVLPETLQTQHDVHTAAQVKQDCEDDQGVPKGLADEDAEERNEDERSTKAHQQS